MGAKLPTGSDGRQQIKLLLPVSRTERKVPAASVLFLLYNGDIQCQLLSSERSLNCSSYLFPACPSKLTGAHQASWFLNEPL